jgi:NodT family efflux transporter outer membrane factor (OMF) lipoprotein
MAKQPYVHTNPTLEPFTIFFTNSCLSSKRLVSMFKLNVSMKRIYPLVLAALLSGCAAIDTQPLPLSQVEGSTLGLQSSQISWPEDQWWVRYHDPQLNGVIERALQQSPSLQIVQARLRKAQAAVGSARAVQLPQVDANYSLTRQRYSERYSTPAPYAGSMYTDTSLRLNIVFDLDIWGKNRALYASALSQEEAASADIQVARNALISAVTQSYFNLQNALAQAAMLKTLEQQYQEIQTITEQRINAGLDTEVELQQARSSLASTRAQQLQAEGNAQLLRNQLASLMGEGPAAGEKLQAVTLQLPAQLLPANIPLELLGRRPDILVAKLGIEASQAKIKAAKADFFPNINLNAFAGFLSLGADNLLHGDSGVYGVGPAISLPIFHGGALNAQLHARQAETDEAIAQYNQRVLDSVREVADAISTIHTLEARQQQQMQAYEAISVARDIAVERYKSGLGNYVQVLLAQNTVTQQALLTTDLRVQAFNADAQLATALGGGFQDQ